MHQPKATTQLEIRTDQSSLGVCEKDWRDALEDASTDPKVTISIAYIRGDENLSFYVASIPKSVKCHFHKHGGEDYSIVSGEGVMLYGKVEYASKGEPGVNHWQEVKVVTGESFTIPEGYAHQLCALGKTPLVIVFSCPHSHLNDDQDRTVLDDSPLLAKYSA
jgi:mannose-6-phosphate isomerase-like protein (cupin superfamily)